MNTKLIALCASFIATITFADNAGAVTPLPPQAIPPVEPQERPPARSPSTSIVVDYADAVVSNHPTSNTSLSIKTRNEIYAMLADEVKNINNVVIIEHQPIASNTQPTFNHNALSTAEQPNGHFRIFARIAPMLSDGQAILNLQLLRAGYSADGQNMVNPISERSITINPNEVRAAQPTIHDFLAANLHMADGQAQETAQRPNLSMWIEVKNRDGSEGVKKGSELVVYYKPDSDVYMNLYHVNEENEIHRLIPSALQQDNFSIAGQIYRFPARGTLTVTGSGTDVIRAIYTRIPSGIDTGLGIDEPTHAKQQPIRVIPTQYPAIFATHSLEQFFSMPEEIWNEYEISYTID